MKTKLLSALLLIFIFSKNSHSQTWSSGRDMLNPVRGGNIASYMDKTNGYLFVISGRNVDRVIKTTQRYNLTTNSWDTLAPHPTGLLGAATATLKDQLYIIGGVINPPGFGQDTVYKFNIHQNKWGKAAPFPYDIVDAKAVAYEDSLIYVAGGVGGPDSANVLVYNAITNSWRKATTIPSETGLNFGGFSRAGNKLIYICGTDGFGSSNYFNTVYVGTIDPVNKSIISWKKGTNFPGKTRSFFDAHPWMNNTIIMTGGSTNNTFDTWSDECYAFDPDKNLWTKLPVKPTAWLTGQSGSVNLQGNEWTLICSGGFDLSFISKTELFKQTGSPSAIKDVEDNSIFLLQNSPNPFYDQTIINYSIPYLDQPVLITIFDAMGRVVETLVNEKQPAGNHRLVYHSGLAAGIYYCSINQGDHRRVVKLICAR